MEDDEIDAQTGDESLSIAQAAAAYAKATSAPVSDDHGKDDDPDESDDTTDEDLQADDAGEDTDGDSDSEENTAEDEDGEPDTEQGRFVADNAKVRLADGTVTTVHELKRGFLREADYTRKTQETSARLKDTESREAQIKATQEQLEQQSRYVTQLVQSIVGEPPPLTMLDPNSPDFDFVGYHQRKANHDAWVQHLTHLQQQDEQSKKQKTEEAAKAEQDKAGKEWAALTEKLPHLADRRKGETFANELRSYLDTFGFEPQDMKAVALDHRLALIADKARRYDKLLASKATVAKKVEGRPPVQKGGRRLSPQESRARAATDALSRVQQSGRLDDGVAALLAIQQSRK